ncbi:MAG TPA: DNA polymerase/3'-5' exonuclease PolX, partial [Candidatus Hydrogenedens sp.]|nr:DNA polymerase/3'-5' exonuclease PolX [Candidatus Hydrogenedens sp.]
IDGENPFKIRSYLKAADTLEHTTEPIEHLIESGQLRQLEGIGEAIEKKIMAWYHNESVPTLEKVKSKYPPSLLELFEVQSLGAKRIKSLFDNLHITNLDELYQACLEGKVSTLPGFNKKIENKIIESIKLLNQWRAQFLLFDGFNVINKFLDEIKDIVSLENIFVAGSIRRYEETIRNINLLFLTNTLEQIRQKLINFYSDKIETKSGAPLIIKKFNIPIIVHFADKKDFGSKMVFYTGSKEYIDKVVNQCSQKKFSFSNNGLFDKNGNKVTTETEEDFFTQTHIPYLPPELRNIYDDMEFVYNHAEKLINTNDIRGVVHCHTLYSDGRNSISELADYCIKKGFDYLVICDHSQSAGYANGLSPQVIIKQHAEIDQLNKVYAPFQILKGIECDIKSDGSLDYPAEILATFDVVIGSIHTKLDMDIKNATQRLIKAIENPYLHILGHPSGRLLLSRKGYTLDMEAILNACAKNNVSIEINANPMRLDLDWRNIYKAQGKNIKFVISVDAHGIEGINDFEFGVYIARKGILTPSDVLNTKNAEEFKSWIKQKK